MSYSKYTGCGYYMCDRCGKRLGGHARRKTSDPTDFDTVRYFRDKPGQTMHMCPECSAMLVEFEGHLDMIRDAFLGTSRDFTTEIIVEKGVVESFVSWDNGFGGCSEYTAYGPDGFEHEIFEEDDTIF